MYLQIYKFRHDKFPTLNDEVKRMQKGANQFKRECGSLKAHIKDLKITIHEQQLNLSSIHMETITIKIFLRKMSWCVIKFVLFRKHKHDLIARDETIKSLQNKLSEANKYIETMKFTSKEMTHESIDIISTEREAFLCRICDKSHISKESLKSHIQTNHKGFHYSNTDILKLRICGNEFYKGELITKICVDNHIIVKHL